VSASRRVQSAFSATPNRSSGQSTESVPPQPLKLPRSSVEELETEAPESRLFSVVELTTVLSYVSKSILPPAKSGADRYLCILFLRGSFSLVEMRRESADGGLLIGTGCFANVSLEERARGFGDGGRIDDEEKDEREPEDSRGEADWRLCCSFPGSM